MAEDALEMGYDNSLDAAEAPAEKPVFTQQIEKAAYDKLAQIAQLGSEQRRIPLSSPDKDPTVTRYATASIDKQEGNPVIVVSIQNEKAGADSRPVGDEIGDYTFSECVLVVRANENGYTVSATPDEAMIANKTKRQPAESVKAETELVASKYVAETIAALQTVKP